MNENTQRRLRRNEKIRKEYLKLKAQKYQGKTQLYSEQTILEKLAEKFALSPHTIDDIICNRVTYKHQ